MAAAAAAETTTTTKDQGQCLSRLNRLLGLMVVGFLQIHRGCICVYIPRTLLVFSLVQFAMQSDAG